MKSIVILFIKSVSFFVTIFFFYSLFFYEAKKLDFWEKALFPSLIISSALLLIHLLFAVKSGQRGHFGTVQQKVIQTNVTIEQLLEKLNGLTRWRLISKQPNCLVYKTGFESIKSFGETIEISSNENGIRIKSRPSLKTTLFDFGKNFQNVKKIQTLLNT